MELSYKSEVGVGIMVIAGLLVFAIGMFWLTGRSVTARGFQVQAMFTNVAGLKEGDPVRISGVKKGRVAQVRLERPGRVTVTLEISTDVRPRVDASATVRAADFFGARFVDYFPGAKEDYLAAGRAIPGQSEQQFQDVATEAGRSANELIGNINRGLNPGQLADDIHNTLLATQRGMEALTQTARGPAVSQATETLKSVERVMARLDTLLGSTAVASTGKRLDTLSVNLTQLTTRLADATASLKSLLDKMERGEGTLGKMATDTLLYRNLNETLTSLTSRRI